MSRRSSTLGGGSLVGDDDQPVHLAVQVVDFAAYLRCKYAVGVIFGVYEVDAELCFPVGHFMQRHYCHERNSPLNKRCGQFPIRMGARTSRLLAAMRRSALAIFRAPTGCGN